jgi:2-(3-amino-3-carboxypropyl)histidine synthase
MDVIKKLKRKKVKKIFIQYPEGLKLRIQDIVKKIEKEGIETIISCEPTYGACDIRDEEAKRFGCDLILHIGHCDFGVKSKVPVIYWDYFLDVDVIPILKKELGKLKNYKKIGLITSLQFVNSIEDIKKFLEKNGKKVIVNKTLKYPGQVLGCDVNAGKKIENKVDCFLSVGAGKFYVLGLLIDTEKPVLSLDLERGEIRDLDKMKRKVQKIIVWNKSFLLEAKKIGILVTWKKGQIKNPFGLKKKLEKKGKEVYILAMDEITPEKIQGLKLDIFINMSCPRIGIDDLNRYKIPIINFDLI